MVKNLKHITISFCADKIYFRRNNFRMKNTECPYSWKENQKSMLYACSHGVTMPLLGCAGTQIKKPILGFPTDNIYVGLSAKYAAQVRRRYLRNISTGFKFEEDVVKERCVSQLPYNEKYYSKVFDTGDIISLQSHGAKFIGRHKSNLKPMPDNVKKSLSNVYSRLDIKQVTKDKINLHGHSQDSSLFPLSNKTKIQPSKGDTHANLPVTFVTQLTEKQDDDVDIWTSLQHKLQSIKSTAAMEPEHQVCPLSSLSASQKCTNWDTFLLSKLSMFTATWIVHECTPFSKERTILEGMLHKWYGTPKETSIVHEDWSDSENEEYNQPQSVDGKMKKRWKKPESLRLLQLVDEKSSMKSHSSDPYSNENLAPFYRQPAAMRCVKRLSTKDDLDPVNMTAQQITLKSVKEDRPLVLKDVLNKGIGSTVFQTDNQYERELFTGVKQLRPSGHGDGATIAMASNNIYRKHLSKEYPSSSQKWFSRRGKTSNPAGLQPVMSVTGARRCWIALPDECNKYLEAQHLVPPGTVDEMCRSHQFNDKPEKKNMPTLSTILHDWRSKWNLSVQCTDATFDDVIHDMTDIQPHVRLKAIAIVVKMAEHFLLSNSDAAVKCPDARKSTMLPSEFPEHVFSALNVLLDDCDDKVFLAAAVALYGLGRPSGKAELILRDSLKSQRSSDRWTAVLCLGRHGICDSQVVDEIVKQILYSDCPVKMEQGTSLLTEICKGTSLVHFIVAEHLNSCSWRHRVIACKLLSALSGSINKDMTHKLLDLMWHDWNREVRQAASQCLGKTSHGRDVHNDVWKCLTVGSPQIKLEALSLISQLGIMTGKLLPAFLACFDDENMSIRSECCITCGNILIREKEILSKLLHLATNDPIWKVKALAIQAIGKLGEVNESIKNCLSWAAHYEKEPNVRAEAYHSLMMLQLVDDDAVRMLMEQLLVEPSSVVIDEIMHVLLSVDVNTVEEIDTMSKIKQEIRKLNTCDGIVSHIIANDLKQERVQCLTSMVCLTEDAVKEQQKAPDKEPSRHNQTVVSPCCDASVDDMSWKTCNLELASRSPRSCMTLAAATQHHTPITVNSDEAAEYTEPDNHLHSLSCESSSAISGTTQTVRSCKFGEVSCPSNSSMANMSIELSEQTLPNDDNRVASHTYPTLTPQISTMSTEDCDFPLSGIHVSEHNHASSLYTGGNASGKTIKNELHEHNRRTTINYTGLSARYGNMMEGLASIDSGLPLW